MKIKQLLKISLFIASINGGLVYAEAHRVWIWNGYSDLIDISGDGADCATGVGSTKIQGYSSGYIGFSSLEFAENSSATSCNNSWIRGFSLTLSPYDGGSNQFEDHFEIAYNHGSGTIPVWSYQEPHSFYSFGNWNNWATLLLGFDEANYNSGTHETNSIIYIGSPQDGARIQREVLMLSMQPTCFNEDGALQYIQNRFYEGQLVGQGENGPVYAQFRDRDVLSWYIHILYDNDGISNKIKSDIAAENKRDAIQDFIVSILDILQSGSQGSGPATPVGINDDGSGYAYDDEYGEIISYEDAQGKKDDRSKTLKSNGVGLAKAIAVLAYSYNKSQDVPINSTANACYIAAGNAIQPTSIVVAEPKYQLKLDACNEGINPAIDLPGNNSLSCNVHDTTDGTWHSGNSNSYSDIFAQAYDNALCTYSYKRDGTNSPLTVYCNFF